MSSYTDLLTSYAEFVGLSPAGDLLESEELVVGDVNIGLMNDDGDVVFFTRLGRPPADKPAEDVYRLMLHANALWAGTGGNTLGLHQPSGEVMLCGRVATANCSAQGLAVLLDSFVDVARVWREIMQGDSFASLPPFAA